MSPHSYHSSSFITSLALFSTQFSHVDPMCFLLCLSRKLGLFAVHRFCKQGLEVMKGWDFMGLSIYGLVYDRNMLSIVITSYMILSYTINHVFPMWLILVCLRWINGESIKGYWFITDQPKYHENIFVGISSDVDYGILIHHEPTKGYMGYWSISAENKPTKTGILMLGYCGNDVPILMVVNCLLATNNSNQTWQRKNTIHRWSSHLNHHHGACPMKPWQRLPPRIS